MVSNVKWQNLSITQKLILFIYMICFLSGGLHHWLDIMRGGIFPYKGIPFIFNLFLTSLAVLDLLVALSLVIRPLIGLILSIVIMIVDLPADLYTGYKYWNTNLFNSSKLQLLLVFGIFVFITAPMLIGRIHKTNTVR